MIPAFFNIKQLCFVWFSKVILSVARGATLGGGENLHGGKEDHHSDCDIRELSHSLLFYWGDYFGIVDLQSYHYRRHCRKRLRYWNQRHTPIFAFLRRSCLQRL